MPRMWQTVITLIRLANVKCRNSATRLHLSAALCTVVASTTISLSCADSGSPPTAEQTSASELTTAPEVTASLVRTPSLSLSPTASPDQAPILAPARTPTPIPRPTRTPAPAATPAPTATPTDEQARQRYRLEMSASLSGQRQLYEGKLAADPCVAGVSQMMLDAVKGAFERVSAAYTLWRIANPSSKLDFVDFLDKHGCFGHQLRDMDLNAGLQDLANQDVLPRKEESLGDYQNRRTNDPWRHERVKLFADDKQMANLIRAVSVSQLWPGTREGAARIIQRSFVAFRYENPTKPLFSEFIDRDMVW